MAFCSKCGTQISENAKFCPGCGSPVAMRSMGQTQQPQGQGPQSAPQSQGAGPQPQPRPDMGQMYGGPAYNTAGPRPQAAPVRGMRGSALQQSAGEYVRSVLFMVSMVCTALFVIASFVQGGFLTGLLCGAPAILMLIGMIFAFVDCRSNACPGQKSQTALTLYKAGKIVELVYWGLFAVLILILAGLAGAGLSAASSYGSYLDGSVGAAASAAGGVVAVLVIIGLALCALFIFKNIKLLGMQKSMATVVKTGSSGKPVSMFPAVLNFVQAGLGLIGLFVSVWLANMINELAYYQLNLPFSISSGGLVFTSLVTIAGGIVNALLILDLRKRI